MRELARRAGVHQTTVSRVLRRDPAVAPSTRARVQALAARLGYVRDPWLDAFNAHRLAGRPRRSPPTLAWVTDAEPASPGAAAALAGARAAAAARGLGFETFAVGPGRLSPERLRRIVAARNLDGVVLASLSLRTPELACDWPRLCALKLESFHVRPALDLVSADHRQAGGLAVERLRTLGYRRIGLALTGSADERLDGLVRAGWLRAMVRRGAREAEAAVWLRAAAGAGIDPRELRAWVRAHRLDAVVSDEAAVGPALRRLRWARGARPGFAGLDVAGMSDECAGIVIDHAALGAWAVQMFMLRRATHQRGLPDRAASSFMPVTWRDGASAPPRRRL